jgi:hypothetical protein
VANFAIIVSMVLLSVMMDFVQEHRASRAAEKLRFWSCAITDWRMCRSGCRKRRSGQ